MQRDVFLNGEGDAYFARNSGRAAYDPSFFLIGANRILEIGCGTGSALHLLGGEGHGIDPSRAAITHGKTHFPNLRLKVGTADQLDYRNGRFDLVIFGFCLYLIDRELLPLVVSEADRVLKPNGHLGIVDFYATSPTENPYHHRHGVVSYHMDYSLPFSEIGYVQERKSIQSGLAYWLLHKPR